MYNIAEKIVIEWLELKHQRRFWNRFSDFIGEIYVRHEGTKTRVVNPYEYATEIQNAGLLYTAFSYDTFSDGSHVFVIWTGTKADGSKESSVQAYRVEQGKIVETWWSAIAKIEFPLKPSKTEIDREYGRQLLADWYDMWLDGSFKEKAPQMCGSIFTRHHSDSTRVISPQQYADNAAAGNTLLREKYSPFTVNIQKFCGSDKLGVIGHIISHNGVQLRWVQAWRIENGKIVETWWPGWGVITPSTL